MPVYVDDWRQRATIGWREGRWSHLLADTEPELHDLADDVDHHHVDQHHHVDDHHDRAGLDDYDDLARRHDDDVGDVDDHDRAVVIGDPDHHGPRLSRASAWGFGSNAGPLPPMAAPDATRAPCGRPRAR